VYAELRSLTHLRAIDQGHSVSHPRDNGIARMNTDDHIRQRSGQIADGTAELSFVLAELRAVLKARSDRAYEVIAWKTDDQEDPTAELR
jgi:hypothetical protein